MPLYDYTCDKCGETEEVQVKLSEVDEFVQLCSTCKEEMRKEVGGTTFILKGSCWARDNYASHVGDDPRYSKAEGMGGTKVDEL